MLKKTIYCLLFGWVSYATSAQNLSSTWELGDDAYKKQDYTKAQEHYEKAKKKQENNPALDYNTGNVYFQQQRTEEARKNWDKALEESKDKNLSADALHNIGNSYLAEKKYKEAIDAYQKSLRQRPNDEDTKKNLQIAKKQMQQQQQQQNQQQQDQKDNKQEQEQQQQQQNQPQNGGQSDKKENQQQQPSSEAPIDRQNAERLLKMLEQEEQKVQRKVKEQQAGKQKHSGKDW